MVSEDFIDILGERYHYRLLSRGGLRRSLAAADGDGLAFEEEVCRACVTGTPAGFPGYDECLAGVPTALCEHILAASGYTDGVSALEGEAHEWANTAEGRLDTLIVFCFPRLSYEELDEMDPRSYYRYAAGSQLVIGGVYGMDARAFLDPNADRKPRRSDRPQAQPNSPYLIE